MLDLFQPPKINPASGRIIRLVDVESSEEARRRQIRDSLKKARAALKAKPRVKQTVEEALAKRRAKYAADKAAGKNFNRPTSPARRRKYYELSEESKELRRQYQLRRYYANRERELERAKAKYAALSPEAKAAVRRQNSEWQRKNRELLNARDRQRRAERRAAAEQVSA